MTANRPSKLNLFAYQVGFGDCFLLQFIYENEKRHMLIDFGTMAAPEGTPGSLLKAVAEDIKKQCGGKLDVVVATHRHADHISGFATKENGSGPGDIIRSLNPRIVLQPWTEDLSLETTARGPRRRSQLNSQERSVRTLNEMNSLAEEVTKLAVNKNRKFSKGLAARLEFLGRDNTKNLSAVENLAEMGKRGKGKYVHAGVKDPLEQVLPGVTTHVLGPPTVDQWPAIQKQRSSDDDEFWHFHTRRVATSNTLAEQNDGPFTNHFIRAKRGKLPYEARWVSDRIDDAREDQLLGIVTMLDRAMNNTSLILLFEVGDKRLLFPGDAQLENWSYALSKPEIVDLLSTVDLYKVGHHGSLNATPKSLWKEFKKRGAATQKERMTSVLSTLSGHHGSVHRNSEVPRRTLVEELKEKTHFHSTEGVHELYKLIEIDL